MEALSTLLLSLACRDDDGIQRLAVRLRTGMEGRIAKRLAVVPDMFSEHKAYSGLVKTLSRN